MDAYTSPLCVIGTGIIAAGWSKSQNNLFCCVATHSVALFFQLSEQDVVCRGFRIQNKVYINIMKVFGIEFAPLNIPLERRLQTLAVILSLLELMTGLYAYLILFFVLFTEYYYISAFCLAWVILDRNTCRRGKEIK